MEKVKLFLGSTESPFQLQHKDISFTRLPCLGELIHLGWDEKGLSADYRVVLVRHIPHGIGQTDADADVYAVRVDLDDEFQTVAPHNINKPTKTDRFFLAHIYRILSTLHPDDARWYERAQTIVERGYESYYDDLASTIRDEVMAREESKEVIDILQLHRLLKDAYKRVTDKTGIDADQIEFQGFDGNHEGKQLDFVRFLCAPEEHKFTELRMGDDYNSHIPMLSRYREMLSRWRDMGEPNEMSKSQILQVID